MGLQVTEDAKSGDETGPVSCPGISSVSLLAMRRYSFVLPSPATCLPLAVPHQATFAMQPSAWSHHCSEQAVKTLL